MIKKITLLFAVFLTINSFAQKSGDVVIYSNTGESFYVILNGIRQNYEAETNVKVQGLTDSFYGCRIISGDNTFTIEKAIPVKPDTLITYRIINKRGKYKLRFFSETALQSAPSEETQSVIAYHATEIPEEERVVQTTTTQIVTTSETTTSEPIEENVTISTNIATTEEHTTHEESVDMNSNTNINEESINVSINAGENGMSVNMNVSGMGESLNTENTIDVQEESNSTYEETTTYSETINGSTTHTETIVTSTTSSNIEMVDETKRDSLPVVSITQCAVDNEGLKKIKTQMENESFADDQIRVGKQVVKSKCLTVSQIKELTEVFSFADDQVNFMKLAYDTCINKDNYYELLDVLTFDDDKKQLENFLDSK